MLRWLPFLIATLWVGCTAEPGASADDSSSSAETVALNTEPGGRDLEAGEAAPPRSTSRSDSQDRAGASPTAVSEPGPDPPVAKSNSDKSGSSTLGKDLTPYQALSDWIGEYPVLEDGTHFVTQPAVVLFLEEALRVESGLMDALGNLANEPVFLAEPIEYVGGAFALEFSPNDRIAEDDRSLYVLIDGETGATYAILSGDGNAYYRTSYNARVADLEDDAMVWIDEASGEDIVALGRQSEDAPISP